jgi:hypothetical protein
MLGFLLLASVASSAQTPRSGSPENAGPIPTIEAKTAGMKHMAGLLPLDWDAKAGKLYMEIPHLGTEVLYTNSLPYGTGSNDLGLDRGQTARSSVVKFERVGPKVLMVEPNESFRSGSKNPLETVPVTESFPTSVLAGFTVAAEAPDGAVLVDATEFFLRDVHNVAETLARMKQGTYKVDPARSAIALDDTKAFPKNTEVEAMLTFATDAAPMGRFVRDVTPDPHAMTIRERTSFVELPALDGSFVPRPFNPRAGYFPFEYRDYNVPLGEDMTQRFIERHRLAKKDPNCTKACEPVKPIQYYVDNGAPEPIRSALLEGARWWDQAFQAAGWAPGTFRVDVLPADADPMDVRYNIIQWVHRYTRGWSYGAAVTDPRTGEILKGNVTLGSLRGRQDYMIAEALTSPYVNGTTPSPDPMLALVLQRIRQLAAHETGHTIGLAHNFAASTYAQNDHNETMSVMEYPHPWITLDGKGKIDIAHAYPVGIGVWDKVAIDYGYREYDKGGKPVEDTAALNKILTDADKRGLIFLTDEDARPFSSASPIDHLWDNGADPTTELNRVLDVRAVALKNFGENAIKNGEPMSKLADVLVPLYLFHRYQTEAAVKVIGGLDYRYNLRPSTGEAGQPGPAIVDSAKQKAALTAVLKTLSPEVLTLPESLLKIIPPVPPGYPRNGESFPTETGLTFDPVATAESAADLTLQVLLDPERASRVVQYHMRTPPASPSLREIMEAISKTTAARIDGGHTMSSEVERAVEVRGLAWMLGLAVNPAASSQARAIALSHIKTLQTQWTSEPVPTDSAEAIHRAGMLATIDGFLKEPEKFVPAKQIEAPPGMPIGDDGDVF